MNEWKQITTSLDTVDWKGNPITLHNVMAEQNISTKKIRLNPDDVAKAEFREIANNLGIQDRDVMLFILLYAKPGPFQRGYLCQKYKINKMLFYQWKRLEKFGFGEIVPKDEFVADKRGPVPKNLWDDLKRLKEMRLIKVEGSESEKRTVTMELTDDGEKIARELWNKIPDIYLGITTEVKSRLFPLNPERLKELVHSEYPEYKKSYKNLDKEETLKF